MMVVPVPHTGSSMWSLEIAAKSKHKAYLTTEVIKIKGSASLRSFIRCIHSMTKVVVK